MNVDKKYFYYVIDDKNKNFHIVESSTKPKRNNSTIETLTKIECILKNKLNYNYSKEDKFSKYDRNELHNFLKNNAILIKSRFNEKKSKQISIFNNEAKVNSLVMNIENFFGISPLFPIPEDPTYYIIKILEINEEEILINHLLL